MVDNKPKITMHGYFRSGASWRMRLYFNFREMEHDTVFVNLVKAEHKSEEYALMNPSKVSVPYPCLRLACAYCDY
jgi:glutathione S-transferase